MSAHRYQATWRSIVFNQHLDNTGVLENEDRVVQAYADSRIELTEMNPVRVSLEDLREMRQWLEGAEANQAFEGIRLVSLRGKVIGSTVADLEDKTWAMYEAFSPAATRIAARALTPRNVIPFYFSRASGAGRLDLLFYCRPAIGRPVIVGRQDEGLSRPFQAELIAYDPFAYGQTQVSTVISAAGTTVTNAGNIYTHPYIDIVLSGAGSTFFTPLINPGGTSMVFDLSTLSAGTYTIDVRRGTFLKSDGTNAYPTRVLGYITKMLLLPGANVVSYLGTTNITSVTVRHRPAYA